MRKYTEKLLAALIILIGLPFIPIILFLDFIFTGQFPVILQERALSLDKKPIKILKIRTIINSIEFKRQENISRNIFFHKEYKNHIPGFCRWLRKSGVDEILQLLNVLKGEMSLAGPRPLLIRELKLMKEEYPDLYKRREKINSTPGITGYWQIYGDRDLGIGNLIESEEYYERNKSFKLDIRIILRTIIVMITATHSDAIIKRKDLKKLRYRLTFN